MENKFTCNDCFGICCINPPLLRTFEEGMRAKRLGAPIVAYPVDGGYMICIEKRRDVCPFLDMETGTCSIYEERFSACRSYQCGLLKLDHGVAVRMITSVNTGLLNEIPKTLPPQPITRAQARKLGARIIRSQNKLIQAVAATRESTIKEMAGEVLVKYLDDIVTKEEIEK